MCAAVHKLSLSLRSQTVSQMVGWWRLRLYANTVLNEMFICRELICLYRWTEKQQLWSHDSRWSQDESANTPSLRLTEQRKQTTSAACERWADTASIGRESKRLTRYQLKAMERSRRPFYALYQRPSLNVNMNFDLPTNIYSWRPVSKFHHQKWWENSWWEFIIT